LPVIPITVGGRDGIMECSDWAEVGRSIFVEPGVAAVALCAVLPRRQCERLPVLSLAVERRGGVDIARFAS